MELPYKLRLKSKVQQKKTEFSETIVKMAKAMLVAKVEDKLEQGESLSHLEPDVITVLQAIRDNPQEWQASLLSELELLIKARIFKILKGPLLARITL